MVFTQNAAESFNSVLWNICPKRTFVGSASINLCAGLAVIVYNDGQQELGKLLKKLGINIGIHTKAALSMQDNQRVQLSIKRTSEKEKKIRQAKRKLRKEAEDVAADKEGTVYESG